MYMNMKNDLSFIFHSYMPMYEHQSTVSPNIPLRDLDYVNRLLRGITAKNDLYGRRPVTVPTPQFIVFYNGPDELPDRSVCRLSDLYEIPQDEQALELAVTILNIKPGHNEKLMQTSKTLGDYSIFVQRVRTYLAACKTEEEKYSAVSRAVSECIEADVLADFLNKHREEAISMSLFEYDEEQHMKTVREEGWEDGYSAGRSNGISDGRVAELVDLVKCGDLPLERAAERAGKTTAEFKEIMEKAIPDKVGVI